MALPRLVTEEFVPLGALLPDAPFEAATTLVSGSATADFSAPRVVPLPDVQLLREDERSKDFNVDALRTITRAKVTRDSLSYVVGGLSRDIAEQKTPAARGLLDEAIVQVTVSSSFGGASKLKVIRRLPLIT